MASNPLLESSESKVVLLLSLIFPGWTSLPGTTSSFPVESTATDGRQKTLTVVWPTVARSPSSAGPSLVP
uniref:Putative secreted protein n=1 Tax=Ixodes ricinus TaxID=34613 RepID=A0A6B0U181_IXORI